MAALTITPLLRRRAYAGVLFTAIIVAAAWLAFAAASRPKPDTVDFLAVGQGDAILIQTTGGQRVLIDTGPDQAVATALARALPWFARELDLVVLTHAHRDHYGGLAAVLKHYRVRRLAYAASASSEPELLPLLDKVKLQEGTVSILDGQASLRLAPTCRLDIIDPLPAAPDLNDRSLISRLECGGRGWLFLGDAGVAAQEALLSARPEWRSEVVKLSHHGSDDGFNQDLLLRLGARAAVIQVGAGNRFGHPSRRILKKLERLGLSVYRTDQDGTIRSSSGPAGLSLGRLEPSLLKW